MPGTGCGWQPAEPAGSGRSGWCPVRRAGCGARCLSPSPPSRRDRSGQRSCLSSPPPVLPVGVGGDGADDDQTTGDVLEELVHLQGVERRVQNEQDHYPGDGAPNAAATAAESRAAHDDGGNRLEVVVAVGAYPG